MPESAIGHNHATELIETHRPSDFIFDLESPDIPTIPEPIKRDARERRLTELPYEQRKKAKTGLITLEEDFSYGMKDIEDETQQLGQVVWLRKTFALDHAARGIVDGVDIKASAFSDAILYCPCQLIQPFEQLFFRFIFNFVPVMAFHGLVGLI